LDLYDQNFCQFRRDFAYELASFGTFGCILHCPLQLLDTYTVSISVFLCFTQRTLLLFYAHGLNSSFDA
jgi:hypothetical protein